MGFHQDVCHPRLNIQRAPSCMPDRVAVKKVLFEVSMDMDSCIAGPLVQRKTAKVRGNVVPEAGHSDARDGLVQ